MAADGVSPLPRLAVIGRHTHHRVVRGMSVNCDDAPTSGNAPWVAPSAAVSIGWDPVIWRLRAVGPTAGGGATFRCFSGRSDWSMTLLLRHGYHLEVRRKSPQNVQIYYKCF